MKLQNLFFFVVCLLGGVSHTKAMSTKEECEKTCKRKCIPNPVPTGWYVCQEGGYYSRKYTHSEEGCQKNCKTKCFPEPKPTGWSDWICEPDPKSPLN